MSHKTNSEYIFLLKIKCISQLPVKLFAQDVKCYFVEKHIYYCKYSFIEKYTLTVKVSN